ncbi:MAG TPA: hypothetical protein PLD82_01380 [Spirochaetota bacterium]|nr:hypothetical protein [Spirochaetota bacterium]
MLSESKDFGFFSADLSTVPDAAFSDDGDWLVTRHHLWIEYQDEVEVPRLVIELTNTGEMRELPLQRIQQS